MPKQQATSGAENIRKGAENIRKSSSGANENEELAYILAKRHQRAQSGGTKLVTLELGAGIGDNQPSVQGQSAVKGPSTPLSDGSSSKDKRVICSRAPLRPLNININATELD